LSGLPGGLPLSRARATASWAVPGNSPGLCTLAPGVETWLDGPPWEGPGPEGLWEGRSSREALKTGGIPSGPGATLPGHFARGITASSGGRGIPSGPGTILPGHFSRGMTTSLGGTSPGAGAGAARQPAAKRGRRRGMIERMMMTSETRMNEARPSARRFSWLQRWAIEMSGEAGDEENWASAAYLSCC
jgi:hypothetical protein